MVKMEGELSDGDRYGSQLTYVQICISNLGGKVGSTPRL